MLFCGKLGQQAGGLIHCVGFSAVRHRPLAKHIHVHAHSRAHSKRYKREDCPPSFLFAALLHVCFVSFRRVQVG